jgi:predicted secreted protein
MNYEMVSVYLPDGIWVGQFMNEQLAKDWLKAKGYKLAECEISTRRVDRKTRKAQEETPVDEMVASS